jgi:homoserine dehydrogenase
MVLDKPGVLADVAAALRDQEISVEAVLQRGHAPGEPVSVVITTHPTKEARMIKALEQIGRFEFMLEPPHMIRIESL